MLLTTTHTLENHPIYDYLGIVTGEAILGADVGELRRAREIAMDGMAAAAAELGGGAVVGVDLDYEALDGSMLMVTASGTAVRIV